MSCHGSGFCPGVSERTRNIQKLKILSIKLSSLALFYLHRVNIVAEFNMCKIHTDLATQSISQDTKKTSCSRLATNIIRK